MKFKSLTMFIFFIIVKSVFASTDFNLSSPIVNENSFLPAKYTCDGADISPKLTWGEPPLGTDSLVLILSDIDAPNGIFYHWVIYDIPKTTVGMDEGQVPQGAKLGTGTWGNLNYKGPCPPKGSLHRYVFTLYALSEPLNLGKGVSAQDVLTAIKDKGIAKTSLIFKYQH